MRRHLLLSALELQSPIDDDEKLRPPPLDFASLVDRLFRSVVGPGGSSTGNGSSAALQTD